MTPLQTLRGALVTRANALRHNIEEARKEPERLKRAAMLLKPVIMAFPAIDTEHDSMSIEAPGWGAYLRVRMGNLEGFKDPRLLKVLEQFVGEPWKTESTSQYVTENVLDRTYWFQAHLHTERGTEMVSVTVVASVRSDSPTCRKVLVGEKPVTHMEQQWEVVCG